MTFTLSKSEERRAVRPAEQRSVTMAEVVARSVPLGGFEAEERVASPLQDDLLVFAELTLQVCLDALRVEEMTVAPRWCTRPLLVLATVLRRLDGTSLVNGEVARVEVDVCRATFFLNLVSKHHQEAERAPLRRIGVRLACGAQLVVLVHSEPRFCAANPTWFADEHGEVVLLQCPTLVA